MNLKEAEAFIGANKWKFASTMPWHPHWYVVRKECDQTQFVSFVEFIREHGVSRPFGKRSFVYFDLNGFTYWTMGNVSRVRLPVNLACYPRRKEVGTFNWPDQCESAFDL